jgi:hypothetical protein
MDVSLGTLKALIYIVAKAAWSTASWHCSQITFHDHTHDDWPCTQAHQIKLPPRRIRAEYSSIDISPAGKDEDAKRLTARAELRPGADVVVHRN